jgi:hypothetical protein
MNDSCRRCRQGRPWLRQTAALATVACVAVLAAACGGGSSPAASATGPTREQAALAYARCMRSHGVPDFPDPDSNGNFHLSNSQQGGGSRGSGSNSGSGQESNPVSSQETAANQVCNHLLDVGAQMNGAQQQHAVSQLVKYGQCMRAHGVPNFPDPHTTSGGIGVPSGIGFDLSGIDLHSPQYQAASHACQPLAAHAKG